MTAGQIALVYSRDGALRSLAERSGDPELAHQMRTQHSMKSVSCTRQLAISYLGIYAQCNTCHAEESRAAEISVHKAELEADDSQYQWRARPCIL